VSRPELRRCPEALRAGCAEVLAGLYDVPGLELPHRPRIIDVGANVGAFTVWALEERWPDATVWAYEPAAETFACLLENTKHLRTEGYAILFRAAVSDREGEGHLFHGRSNAFEHSLVDVGSQRREGESVTVMAASSLRACDLIKVDTEGSEVAILSSYRHLAGCACVLLEWHKQRDREELARILERAGFERWAWTGTREEKWLRRDVAAAMRGRGLRGGGP
jgi:FkbM family methyltransferase